MQANPYLRPLSDDEAMKLKGTADPITLTLVLAIMAISVMAMVVWKLFVSGKGKITLPGGFSFEWSPGMILPIFRMGGLR